MEENQSWRLSYFPKPLQDTELLSDLKEGAVYFCGRDFALRPALVMRAGRVPFAWDAPRFARLFMFCMEYFLRYMAVPGRVENVVVIIDLQDISYRHMAIPALMELKEVFTHQNAGRVFCFYVCNMPFLVRALVNVVEAAMTERARQKIRFLSDVSQLREDFALNQLERDLGGCREDPFQLALPDPGKSSCMEFADTARDFLRQHGLEHLLDQTGHVRAKAFAESPEQVDLSPEEVSLHSWKAGLAMESIAIQPCLPPGRPVPGSSRQRIAARGVASPPSSAVAASNSRSLGLAVGFAAGLRGLRIVAKRRASRLAWRGRKGHGRLAGVQLQATAAATEATESEADVVVIGSGLAGLTCAGVLAAAGKSVTVLESHYVPGGAAHTFRARAKGIKGDFCFDSGPSLYGGLSGERTSSPLKHVYQILGEEPEWITYDRWNAFIPEGEANAAIGYEEFVSKLLPRFGGPDAPQQWERLMNRIIPMADAICNGPPPSFVREDLGVAATLARYLTKLKSIPGGPQKLSEPFSQFLEDAKVTDPFIKNWMDMFAFLLQGLPSYGAPTSMMAYMMGDMYKKNTCLDFPKGGNEALVGALVRGLEKHGGQVLLKKHVEEVLVEGGRAAGVRLKDGHVIRAPTVVSNADWQVTKSLIKEGSAPELEDYLKTTWKEYKLLKSFIHLHLGFRGDGLPSGHCEEFPAQWGVFNSWSDLEAPRNAVLVSCPSMLDPDLAPPGHHVVHAYTPATEPWEDWADLDEGSSEYKKKKQEARDFLYSAVAKQVPDLEDRVVLELVGTPRTHRRFLRKPSGTYGLRVQAPEMLPGHKTPLEGFHMCGDSTAPGIGVPAVVMSGHICANNIMSVPEHWQILDKIKDWTTELEI
ncbi:CRTISO [Symbiodinium necroappetens]|uniref:CRTISO protein n=1 Tax=Symbiodinium necroappetens TaxID=1628268 RepID=A0A812M820_9DINO|nr:CRTISO [Symbiodinium necroappetens]